MANTLIAGDVEPYESSVLDEFLMANDLRHWYEQWYDRKDEIPSENYRDKSLGIDHLNSYRTLFGAMHSAMDLSTACLPSDIEIEWQCPCSSLIIYLPMWLKGKVVYCKPDSGSDENVMSLELAISLGLTIVCEQRYQRDFTSAMARLSAPLAVLISITGVSSKIHANSLFVNSMFFNLLSFQL